MIIVSIPVEMVPYGKITIHLDSLGEYLIPSKGFGRKDEYTLKSEHSDRK